MAGLLNQHVISNHRQLSLDAAIRWNTWGGYKRGAANPEQIFIERNGTLQKYAQAPKNEEVIKKNAHRDSSNHQNDRNRASSVAHGVHHLGAKIESRREAIGQEVRLWKNNRARQRVCPVIEPQRPEVHLWR